MNMDNGQTAGRGELSRQDLEGIARKGYLSLVAVVFVWAAIVHFVSEGTPTLLVNLLFLVVCVSLTAALYRIVKLLWKAIAIKVAAYLVLAATILVVRYVVLAVLARIA